jgi:hypothetical protein
MQIKQAFEKYGVPSRRYLKRGRLMALRDAIHNYLGRDAGFGAAIHAVIDGALVPVGRTSRFPGIAGYLFSSEDLRRYRPVRGGSEAPPGGFLSYTEAAPSLACKTQVIRALVELGVLSSPAGRQRGRCKLVAAADVQHFSNCYVGLRPLARHLHVTGCRSARYLKKVGMPTLAVLAGPEEKAIFLDKEAAARVRSSCQGKLSTSPRVVISV